MLHNLFFFIWKKKKSQTEETLPDYDYDSDYDKFEDDPEDGAGLQEQEPVDEAQPQPQPELQQPPPHLQQLLINASSNLSSDDDYAYSRDDYLPFEMYHEEYAPLSYWNFLKQIKKNQKEKIHFFLVWDAKNLLLFLYFYIFV